MTVQEKSERYSPHGYGYVKVYRKLLTSAVFQSEKLLKVWIWCLIRANWHEATCFFEGKEIPLEAGQFITGRFTGSEELGMGASTFYKLIKKLEEMGNLSIKADNKKSIITVVKYKDYQGEILDEWQQKNNKVATEEQQSSTDKEVKNIKNDKKTTFPEESQEFQLSLHLFNGIRSNDPKAKEPDLQKWASEIDKLIRIDKRTPEEIARVIEFSQSDSFWKSNILSTATLRKQFPKLFLKANNGNTSNRSSYRYDPEKYRRLAEEFAKDK